MIVDAQGRPVVDTHATDPCDHGVTFDAVEARKVLEQVTVGDPDADALVAFIMGNPNAAEVRRRWPRHSGNCPKGCGYHGIAYASYDHYIMGDW